MSILRIKDANGKIIEIPALKGDNGKSAYEIAVDKGFKGTEEEWLESLKSNVDLSEYATKEYVDTRLDGLETALDNIIALQESYIGGEE